VPGAGSSPRTRLGEANLHPTRPSPAYLWHDILTTSQPWYIYNSGMNIVSSFSYLSAARTWRIKFSCLKYIRVHIPGWLPFARGGLVWSGRECFILYCPNTIIH
jgi:hypothetical protein